MLPSRVRLLLLLCIAICSCMFALVPFSARVRAASDPMTVTSQSDMVTFPKTIDFQMSAQDTAGSITTATIVIVYKSADYEDMQPVKIATPSPSVALHWQMVLTDKNFLPVGSQLAYYWVLQDNTGYTHTEKPQDFSIQDPRFSWQSLSSGLLQINWYNRPTSFGQAVLSEASNDIKRIGDNLGGGLQNPITVWIYQTDSDFRGALPPGTYEWVGGIAFPAFLQASFVVDGVNDDTLIRAMPHELTHLVFHQLIGLDTPAPRWFDEGMAVYHQIYREPEMALQFKEALTKHTLLRVNTLETDFPADADQAYLAYAQSWNLVSYMYSTFGRGRMIALINAMKQDRQQDFNQDLARSVGVDELHLENQWRLSLHQPSILPLSASPSPAARPAGKSVPTPITTDSSLPLLILIGILLMIVPAIGLGGLFVYQHASLKHEQLEAAHMQSLGQLRLSRPQAMLPINYADSRSYDSAQVGLRGVKGEARQHTTLVDLPAQPARRFVPAQQRNNLSQDGPATEYSFGQEYSHYPDQRISQE